MVYGLVIMYWRLLSLLIDRLTSYQPWGLDRHLRFPCGIYMKDWIIVMYL
jgi:hypothetical protein